MDSRSKIVTSTYCAMPWSSINLIHAASISAQAADKSTDPLMVEIVGRRSYEIYRRFYRWRSRPYHDPCGSPAASADTRTSQR